MGVCNFVTLPSRNFISTRRGITPSVASWRKKPHLERIFEDGHYTLWGK